MLHPISKKNRSSEQSLALTESCDQSMVVVDAAVTHYQDLLANHSSGLDIHILDAHKDGIAQLQALLSMYQPLSSLHLICQGAPGKLRLGTTLLSEVNLWAYADNIRQWRISLNNDAEIFIYGCDLAANRVGRAFVSWLQFLTGADIRIL